MEPAPPLQLRDRTLVVDRCLIMGVVNATTDSFSDAARYGTLGSRIELAEQLISDGADLIDVGGESALTDVPAIAAEHEAEAVVPIVAHLRRAHPDVPVSVDTYKPPVARAALDAGAQLVNDTSGLIDPDLATVVAEARAGLVVMHTRSRPKQRLRAPGLYDDVVADVVSFLRQRVQTAVERGVPREAIVVDPGPDFSKTPRQTVTVLQHLDAVRALGRPVLLALSRKDFIGAITCRRPDERLAGTLAALAHCGGGPGDILRVHDVGAAKDFLTVLRVLRGQAEIDADLQLPDSLRRSHPR
jgi:dihydropteroate synthase